MNEDTGPHSRSNFGNSQDINFPKLVCYFKIHALTRRSNVWRQNCWVAYFKLFKRGFSKIVLKILGIVREWGSWYLGTDRERSFQGVRYICLSLFYAYRMLCLLLSKPMLLTREIDSSSLPKALPTAMVSTSPRTGIMAKPSPMFWTQNRQTATINIG